MQFPIIKYYNPSKDKQTFCFYILCKGKHSGRPLNKPIPNCYIIICNDRQQQDYFYWLCFGLFHTRVFENDLIGSVIPFLRIGDFKKRLNNAYINTAKHPSSFNLAVEAMNKHHELSIKLTELMQQKNAEIQKILRYHILVP
ncbi:MAG: hypothetical protein WBO44_14135 [Saprospiraceae bacterium]